MSSVDVQGLLWRYKYLKKVKKDLNFDQTLHYAATGKDSKYITAFQVRRHFYFEISVTRYWDENYSKHRQPQFEWKLKYRPDFRTYVQILIEDEMQSQ